MKYKAFNCYSERERHIVASFIQWLGTPIGTSFLNDCGFIEESRYNRSKARYNALEKIIDDMSVSEFRKYKRMLKKHKRNIKR
ncbi:MAG: hypothetical protein PF569_09170 [Candidatus Woesearchaeota archaeon]|nr:hypothetical protein [Candidatus Woesearchaeota archaeon]